jgi:NADPH-dependent 2,4-dienoyl-CoA reductase/sulfur reductase-like enzyme
MREGGRLVVVGGVAAGMSAASRARRLRPDIGITVFERGGDVSYGSCLLPYFVSGAIEDRDSLVRVTAESFRTERRVDVRLHTEVTAIDRVRRTVSFRGRDGEGQVSYDALVIATGASAVRPPLPGIDIPGVVTLRTLSDGEHLRALLDAGGVTKATVVGGGYIGLEMAEALVSRGVAVTIVELLPTVFSTFDADMSEFVARELLDAGVEVRTGTGVEGFETRDGGTGLGYVIAGGQRLASDLALVSVGVRPSTGLASAAGIELGTTGAIRVNARQVTSEPSILAAGDCAEAHHVVTGKPAWIPLGTTANKQGKLAGENAVGGSARFGGIAGTNIAKVFGLEAAQTGLTEGAAADEGLAAESVKIRSTTRAHAYPGAGEVRVKLVFEPDGGRLLGGQIVGREGAGKRVDTIAAALHAKMTVSDLAEVDMSYAPPFSPVWDPVAMAALQAVKKVRS